MDVVLSDIHMPGMDGLQLLEQIHRNWPNCSVIFLTGYNDFDLVYQAIKYPGTKYILKSEPHDKVLALLDDHRLLAALCVRAGANDLRLASMRSFG